MTDKDTNSSVTVYNRSVKTGKIYTNSWNAFYKVLNSMTSDDTFTVPSGKWIYASYSLNQSETKNDFPKISIETANILSRKKDTLDVDVLGVGLKIYLYTTSSLQADVLADKIREHIKANKITFYNYGIKDPYIRSSISSPPFDNGGYVLHERELFIEFDYYESGYNVIA